MFNIFLFMFLNSFTLFRMWLFYVSVIVKREYYETNNISYNYEYSELIITQYLKLSRHISSTESRETNFEWISVTHSMLITL